MKKIMCCRVTIFLLVGWVSLSVIGYLGKDSIYKRYTHEVRTTPYFVLVLQGIHDGIYPWSGEKGDFWEDWNSSAEGSPWGEGEKTFGESLADTETSGDMHQEGPGTLVGTEASDGTQENTETMEDLLPREFIAVDESYFDDAVFIGDSRTVGLQDYSDLDNATFYATVGLNVYDMWKDKFCEVDGKKVTLEEALSAQQFKKVYFQVGINEMGRGTLDSFMQVYSDSVEKIKQLQPDAIVFVQGIMRVGGKKSATDKIFNNPGINERNERIAQLADERTVFYIDVNDVVCDEEGNLRKDLSYDQLHLLASEYSIWVEYLRTKGIELAETE